MQDLTLHLTPGSGRTGKTARSLNTSDARGALGWLPHPSSEGRYSDGAAGATPSEPAEDADEYQYDAEVEGDFSGLTHCCSCAVRFMRTTE